MVWTVIILGVLLDQLTKIWVAANLPYETPIPIIGNIFSLDYIHNEGAAWSILSGRVGFLLVITVLVTVVIAYLLYKTPKDQKLLRFSFALLIAGALGNIIDRVRLGYVIDFLRFPDFPIFNIADCFVTVSIALIVILTLIDVKKESDAKKAATAQVSAQSGRKAKKKQQ
jgi:signal peptidase II